MASFYSHKWPFQIPFLPIILMSASFLCAFVTDVYMPCFPSMQDFYKASVTTLEWSLNLYFVGFSLGSLCYGAFSDTYGRRPTMIVGFGIFVLGSFICLIPHSIYFLLAGRLIQGIGAAVSPSVGFAMIKDVYPEKPAVRLISLIGMIISLSPTIAPTIGVHINIWVGGIYNFFRNVPCFNSK